MCGGMVWVVCGVLWCVWRSMVCRGKVYVVVVWYGMTGAVWWVVWCVWWIMVWCAVRYGVCGTVWYVLVWNGVCGYGVCG